MLGDAENIYIYIYIDVGMEKVYGLRRLRCCNITQEMTSLKTCGHDKDLNLWMKTFKTQM